MPTYSQNPTTDGNNSQSLPTSDLAGLGADYYKVVNFGGGSGTAQLMFDLSSIPAGATIQSATLALTATATEGASVNDYAVHRIASGNSGWTSAATWNTKDGTNAWAGGASGCDTAGTDYDTTAMGTWSNGASDPAGTVYTITLDTTEVANLLAANYGLVLIETTSNGQALSVASQENTTAAYRPLLTINYQTATMTASPATVVESQSGVTISLTGTNTSWTAGTPGSPTFTASAGTITDQSVQSATAATLTYTAPATAGNVTITDPSSSATATVAVDPAATSYTLTGPSTVSDGQGSLFTVSLPSGDALSSVVTVTPSDGGAGGTFTPSTVSFPVDTAAASVVFSYTPSVSSGSITISTTNNGGLTNPAGVTVTVGAAQPGAYNNSNIRWSPYNWMLGAAYRESDVPNAQVDFFFTLASTSVSLAVEYDASPWLAIGSLGAPLLNYSIDYGAWTTGEALDLSTNVYGTIYRHTLAASGSLAAGSHYIRLRLSFSASYNRWTSLIMRLTRFCDSTGAALTATAPPTYTYTDNIVFFGDSITEDTANVEWPWGFAVAEALSCNAGIIGYQGQGWQWTNGSSGIPYFHVPGDLSNQTWRYYDSGNSRLVGGQFSPVPKYIYVAQGENDYGHGVSGSEIQASVSDFLVQIRTACPTSIIFIQVPLSQFYQTNIAAAVNASSDPNVHLIDLGPEMALGLNSVSGGAATWRSAEGIHPTADAQVEVTARLTQKALSVLTVVFALIGAMSMLGVGR